MATLTPSPKIQFFDTNGDPLVGGKLYSYAAGTTTPIATYTSSSESTPNANPVILDSRGEANVWLGGGVTYKLKLTTATDVDIWTVDNIINDVPVFPPGSATAPAVFTGVQPNTGLFFPGSSIAISLLGSEQYRFTTAGLGLGLSAPVSIFHAAVAADSHSLLRNSSLIGATPGVLWDTQNAAQTAAQPLYMRASQFSFGTGTGGSYTARATIDTSGNFTTNGQFTVNIADTVGAFNTNGWNSSSQAASAGGFIGFHYSATGSNGFSLYRARGSFSSVTDSLAGDSLGLFRASGWNNSSWRTAATIQVEQESYTAGVGYTPGTMRFYTADNVTGAQNENFRIFSTGVSAFGGAAGVTGYGTRGDVVLPAARSVRAYNTLKAWVNFNGSIGGTFSPRAHFNVASITRVSAGDYTLNITAGILADANYCITASGGYDAATGNVIVTAPYGVAPTTTALAIKVTNDAGTDVDATYVCVMISGN